MINNVVLTGRLTRDHDLRYTPTTNQPVARFTLAVQRRMPNKQTGQRESDFISCTAFGKTAEILAQYTRKGSLIGVEGNIRTGRYENQQGQTVYTTDVIVNSFTFLESNSANQQNAAGTNTGYNNGFEQPTQSYTNPAAPQASTTPSEKPNFSRDDNMFGGDAPFEISDDDLPF